MFKASPSDIVAHHEQNLDENPWVRGTPHREAVSVVAYDPEWPVMFARLAREIERALGAAALRLEHVGSTAMAGLAAKPVIDIDLIVDDPTDEESYVPALEALGYRLTIRERNWHEHRCLRREAPRANLHVFGPDCPENIRHRLFRDWLREHEVDRAKYERAKREALQGACDVHEYNQKKQPIIRAIYDRVFQAAGLRDSGPG